MTTAAKKEAVPAKAIHKYYEGVGRRKTATARVRVTKGSAEPTVNGKPLAAYFQKDSLRATALKPLAELQLGDSLAMSAKVSGGGVQAQADAVRHGLARAIAAYDESFKPRLRASGYMTRDPRMVERKKFGLKKARRAPQWAKR